MKNNQIPFAHAPGLYEQALYLQSFNIMGNVRRSQGGARDEA
jgi:hypothetical protein